MELEQKKKTELVNLMNCYFYFEMKIIDMLFSTTYTQRYVLTIDWLVAIEKKKKEKYFFFVILFFSGSFSLHLVLSLTCAA